MAREKILTKLTYRKGAMVMKKALLPKRFPYMAPNTEVESIEVKTAGTIEVNGEGLEFQDVRVLVRMLDCPASEEQLSPERELLRKALRVLGNMTSEQFTLGADRELRREIALALGLDPDDYSL